ncbi:helix-turn-helix domain-containing protein [Natrarchaeobius chitinivorans]|uniref:Bacterio-opsin activator n=1 Tax=Natrarchaeobius chitinivorans TaxID=1679083 RepID=A0A3N6LRA5_NATCH|nr:helix-turn-helix domain-containing protein [Natrarchaeobius chitinivorans]RQG89634.1 bacterio-opsin activator [Natrarchaeobius chitinivorans]
MSVITEFTIPAEAFALEHTFQQVPDLSIEVERLATHSREWIMPFLWVRTKNPETVETPLNEDPSVESAELIETGDDVAYFNIHWSEDVQSLIDQIVNQHGIIQEAEALDNLWYLKLQFVDQEALQQFQDYFHDKGYSFELQRIYDGTARKEREYNLTPEQREVLVTALEMGYFNVPREAQIGDLAEKLDISTNSVSERLRRASANLTRNTVTVSAPKADSETG